MNLNPFEDDKCLKLEKKADKNLSDDEYEYFSSYNYDYDELVNSITDKVDWKVFSGQNDYQGDYFCFGEGNGKYYFLDFGYGSCSGCDALQGCSNFEELLDLRDGLKRDIKEFNSFDEFTKWIKDQGEYKWWNNEDIAAFENEIFKVYGKTISFKDWGEDK